MKRMPTKAKRLMMLISLFALFAASAASVGGGVLAPRPGTAESHKREMGRGAAKRSHSGTIAKIHSGNVRPLPLSDFGKFDPASVVGKDSHSGNHFASKPSAVELAVA